ncbi:DUF4446 family protein [Patescibacteria group bacterium]|nr:DUF4446 family protein [Patescibacteria group bacterium]
MSLASMISWLTLASPYMALGALVVSLIAVALLLAIRRRFMRLAFGRSGSIEESIAILLRDTKELQHFRIELEKYLKNAELRLRGSVQGVGVVRFNAFAGSATGGGAGGNQSFSAAFLDEELSGVVLSTLYSRNHVGVYAKPVEKGSSSFELTTEERDAIAKAKLSIAVHKKHASPADGKVSA